MQFKTAFETAIIEFYSMVCFRKETFSVMTLLSKESQRSMDLENKLQELESKQNTDKFTNSKETRNNDIYQTNNIALGEFGSWMSLETDDKIDFNNKEEIEHLIMRQNSSYEDYLKRGLGYFHEKFKALFEKMTSIVIQTSDHQNKWSIQEEQYKAQIENLKIQLNQKEEDDISENSPGLVTTLSSKSLERKYSFLEESYRYIRTLNENMKNEILECKKESMLTILDYESQTQTLMLNIANLFDKLRSSISIDIFWKQNFALNQALINHRKLLEINMRKEESVDLFNHLEELKIDIIDNVRKDFLQELGNINKYSN